MSAISIVLDDSEITRKLVYSEMATKSVTQKIIDYLVPRHFPTLLDLQVKLGVSYATVQRWKHGDGDARVSELENIAHVSGFELHELLQATQKKKSKARLDSHHEWSDLLEKTKKKHKNKLPEYAYVLAGATCPAVTPTHLTEDFIFDLAQFWFKNASDEELIEAEKQEVLEEMATDRAKEKKFKDK